MQTCAMVVTVLLAQASAEPGKTDGAAATAQQQPAAGPQQPPQLPPEGKRWIESFVGKFRSNDVVSKQGDRSAKGTMEVDCRRTSGGWASACTAKLTLGKRTQLMSFLHGWDVATGTAHLFEVTSMGEVHDHAGKWDDDRTITVTHHGKTGDGKDEEDQLTFVRTGPREMKVTGKGTAGDAQWSFGGTFKKL